MYKEFDPKAIKILENYDPATGLSPQDFLWLEQQSLAFAPVQMTHDEAVQWALDAFKKSHPAAIANSFLYGLAHDLPELRTAMAAYAVMRHYPDHGFDAFTDPRYCKICFGMKNQLVDLTFKNRCRWAGGLVGTPTLPETLGFVLTQHNKQAISSAADPSRFIEILNVIEQCQQGQKNIDVAKAIRKIPGLKISLEHSRYMLDTLGHASILQTEKHKGWLDAFHGYLTPHSSRSSDWAYPIDFWRAADGIHVAALRFWFGAHPAIMNWADDYLARNPTRHCGSAYAAPGR